MRLIDADQLKEQDFGEDYYTIKAAIDKTPTVNAKLIVHGSWVSGGPNQHYFCSECGEPTFDKGKYCSHCGAEMR